MTTQTTTEPLDHLRADDQEVLAVLLDALASSREREYTGWDYGDGMSSRIRRALPFENRWVNLAFQETAKRTPINLRPLLLVEQRRNYKGTALFAMTNLNVHELLDSSTHPDLGGSHHRDSAHDYTHRRGPDVDYTAEARELVEWLIEERCRGYSGFCGGHRHEIQHLRTKGVPNDPDVVSTSYAVQALLAASRFEERRGNDESADRYAEIARTAAEFVVEDLNYRELDGGAMIDYHLNHPDDAFTLNAGALGARLFVDLYNQFGDERLLERAERILDYLVGTQTDAGGWYYREPPSTSHLSMDNHHNGFIVEAFLRYREVVGDGRYDATIRDALEFYRHTLFEPDGAPNFDESSAYPRDIHAAAQGILVFTYADEPTFARRILEWTFENLYDGEGRFYFRKHRFYTRRVNLMRWCQAWMAYAASEYLTTT